MKLVEKLPGPINGAILNHVKKAGGKVAATVTGGVGTVVGGPVGTVLGTLAGGEAKLLGGLGKALGDDIFPPQTVDVTLNAANQALSGNAAHRSLKFKGHGGLYQVDCEWRLA